MDFGAIKFIPVIRRIQIPFVAVSIFNAILAHHYLAKKASLLGPGTKCNTGRIQICNYTSIIE
jgi:hypothetical protein